MCGRADGKRLHERERSVRVAIQYGAFCDAQVRERGATTGVDPKYNLKMRSINSSVTDRVSAHRCSRSPRPDAAGAAEDRPLRKVGLAMVGGWADSAVAGAAFEEWNQVECSTDIPAAR